MYLTLYRRFHRTFGGHKKTIKGFAGARTDNPKRGTLRWQWADDVGKKHTFEIPNSYYVPSCELRLLSPQHWAQTRNTADRETTRCITSSKNVYLRWTLGEENYELTLPLNKRGSNVGTLYSHPGYNKYDLFCQSADITIADDKDPIVLPAHIISDEEDIQQDNIEPQRGPSPITIPKNPLFTWPKKRERTHNAISEHTPDETPRELHLSPEQTGMTTHKLPAVIEDDDTSILIDEEDRQASTPEAELLIAHYRFQHISFSKLQEMARQGILPRKLAHCKIPSCSACLYGKATKRAWRSKLGKQTTKRKTLKPGEVISVDQMVSPVPGLIAQMVGFLTRQRYKYATVFVDQASRMGFVYLQKTCTAEETIEAKRAFEQYAENRGVKVQAYHADNGIFKAKKWVEECQQRKQDLTFAGVNAHHQNGIAERRIRELQETTRAMLIHATKRWPGVVTIHLWPYAIRMANQAYNATPLNAHINKQSPNQIFDNSAVDINPKHWKPFGCPTYVLKAELQGTTGIHPKWDARSRAGIYLGQSPIHNRNVALVLNIHTGYVSPQFHVKFDESFRTVLQDKWDATWLTSTGFIKPSDRISHEEDSNVTLKRRISTEQQQSPKGKIPDRPGNRRMVAAVAKEPTRHKMPLASNQYRPANPASHLPSTTAADEQPVAPEQAPNTRVLPMTTTRSGRLVKPVPRLIDLMMSELGAIKQSQGINKGELLNFSALTDEADKDNHPLLAYKAVNPDILRLHEAMKATDKREFKTAMEKEVNDQIANGNFTVIPRSEVPKGFRVFPGVWTLVRKRDIQTREIKKYKARLAFDGSRMREGEDYDKTYAPVASWMSIRLLLTFVVAFEWHTQVDYVAAYTQAPIDRDMYMEFPRGFTVPGGADRKAFVLKLHRNLYGQKQAGRVWYKYLRKRLITQAGFIPSKHDECLFFRGKVLYALYIDDSILGAPTRRELDEAITAIKEAKLQITLEGDLADFLGVKIERKSQNEIIFTQPHLIDDILQDLGLQHAKEGKETPAASSRILTRNDYGAEHDKSFHYRSVIGKLNYLEKATRPDISFATHQCARYMTDPKKSHARAVRWIGRYLLHSRRKGIRFKADITRGLEVFVDASFAGNWDKQDALTGDRDTARSRHGYIILYYGCPLIWKSQLQTEIALSSTESEYTGLSYALREAIPLMTLLEELKTHGFPVDQTKASVQRKVFEDNSGAIEIATNHKWRPRTKHLNCRLHHFWSHVPHNISIQHIPMDKQPADILTKAVDQTTLSRHRSWLMGW